jgi:hypothetical protein
MTLERPQPGDGVHTRAVERLQSARDQQSRLRYLADAARGTPAEHTADDQFREADNRVAAGEAWLTWLERGF